MFNYLEYVEKHISNVTVNSTGQIIVQCPFCEKPKKMYIDRKTGNYICFSCNEKGRSLVGLVAKFEGISRKQAREFIKNDESSLAREMSLSDMLKRMRPVEEIKEQYKVNISLPKGFIPVFDGKKWRYPVYLKRRKIPREIAHMFGLGFVSNASCRKCPLGCHLTKKGYPRTHCRYNNRIVLPIKCPNGLSFTARDITNKHPVRYLNPKQAGHAKLVFGWDQCKFKNHIVLVEGAFDAINMRIHGFDALALNGKVLHEEQQNMFWGLPSSLRITVMLDAGETVAAIKTAKILADHFDSIKIARLEGGVDPGDATYDQAMEAIMGAQDYTLFGGIKERLKKIAENS